TRRARRKPDAMRSHEPRTTNNEPRTTSHEQRATNNEPRTTMGSPSDGDVFLPVLLRAYDLAAPVRCELRSSGLNDLYAVTARAGRPAPETDRRPSARRARPGLLPWRLSRGEPACGRGDGRRDGFRFRAGRHRFPGVRYRLCPYQPAHDGAGASMGRAGA